MLFKPLDKDAFAQTVLRAAQEADLGPLVYDPAEFSLKGTDRDVTVHLGNVFAEYRAARPWQRNGILAGFMCQFQGLTETLEPSAEEARATLRPRIRERAYFGVLRLRDEIEGTQRSEPPFRELGGGHLTLEVVLGRPDTIRSVSAEHLADWGLTFEDALAIGNENLLRLGTSRFQSPRPGLFVSAWRDVYDASRLHLGEVVTGLPAKGRPVAMVPNRNTLIVTGADDPEGLAAMARLTEEALKQPRPMTGYAFRLDNGWVPFLPPVEHPAFVALHRLAVQTLAGDYEEQKGLLDALHKKNGLDVFVASVMVMEDRGTKDRSSVATWAEGADTFLPRMDKVAFIRPVEGKEPNVLGMADWARVKGVLGSLLEPQGLYPERFRGRGFPTEEQLGRLELA